MGPDSRFFVQQSHTNKDALDSQGEVSPSPGKGLHEWAR
jgi:hypothetical protein